MIIEKVLGSIDDFDQSGYALDFVILDGDALTKTYHKMNTENGIDIEISIPRGESLFHGALLYRDEGIMIFVNVIDEDILEIFPDGGIQWGQTAFNIAYIDNPAYLNDKSIMTPYDSGLERLLKALKIEYVRKNGKLQGKSANARLILR